MIFTKRKIDHHFFYQARQGVRPSGQFIELLRCHHGVKVAQLKLLYQSGSIGGSSHHHRCRRVAIDERPFLHGQELEFGWMGNKDAVDGIAGPLWPADDLVGIAKH